MMQLILAIAYTLIVTTLAIFVIYRLKVSVSREAGGRGLLYAGAGFIVGASLVNVIQALPGYLLWFLPGVYPYIDILEFVLLGTGAVLFVTGLIMYFTFWGDRDVEVANHLEKLKLLDSLQQESRYPYPMMELLERVLKGLLAGLDEQAGAVFLFNRDKRTFVLATAVGLKKEEIALLEYYPYGHNIVSQAIEDDTAMITGDFRSLGGKAQLAASNYRSILVTPLKSGTRAVGAMLFFSTEERRYTREYMQITAPIAEWLVQKIEVSRLTRELKRKDNELTQRNRYWQEFSRRLHRMLESSGRMLSPAAFTERCLGLAEADEVWLLGLVNGRLTVHGGTKARAEFSENFKTALVGAINKRKAVILNQEGVGDDGNAFIARSSVFCPVGEGDNAILLRKNTGAITLHPEDLRLVETMASVAAIIIEGVSVQGMSATHKRGFDAITDVLKMSISLDRPDDDIAAFFANVVEICTDEDVLLLYRRANGRFKVVQSKGNGEDVHEISLGMGEGTTGKTAILRIPEALATVTAVEENLSEYDEENRIALRRLFGERERPSFQGDYPVVFHDRTDYILTWYGFGEKTAEHQDRHRLLTVLVGLLNLRIELLAVADRVSGETTASPLTVPEQLINEVNNDLSAIAGYCQLAEREPNLPGDVSGALTEVLKTTERMAKRFRGITLGVDTGAAKQGESANLNDVVRAIFTRNSISGNLHMIGGRPFEVNLVLGEIPDSDMRRDSLIALLNEACQVFTASVSEDEIITISTYTREDRIYLDISRHRKNFPPVEPVARFGRYLPPEQLAGQIADSSLLKLLQAFHGEAAVDRYSRVPSYYSFRLPLTTAAKNADYEIPAERPLTILAVDDQVVILDLLAAMCQSLGYTIVTTRDSRKGAALYQEHRPDIVIVDYAMPEMNGLELARHIKAVSPNAPIILITGWGVELDQRQLTDSGIDYVLHKPFRLEQLSDAINRLKKTSPNR
ncbi:MAG: response regulator [candidate division Zixibacteria bacterium]|nr:response regulator [candidate division Zixibacteria bacterium]